MMYASNNIENGAPNGVNALWVGDNRSIKIYNDDPNYAKIIYITVQARNLSKEDNIFNFEDEDEIASNDVDSSDETDTNSVYKFKILYRLSGNIQLAAIGDQLIDTTEPGIA